MPLPPEPTNPHPDAGEPNVPDSLAARLRRSIPSAGVPEGTDDLVLTLAARHFAARGRRRRMLSAASLAAAAGLALAASLYPFFRTRQAPIPPAVPATALATALAGDLNADGRVDINDAFLLARSLRDGAPIHPEWDFTRDGAVDRADVDAIAMAAVRLDMPAAGGAEGAS